jgi:hypothetical protein
LDHLKRDGLAEKLRSPEEVQAYLQTSRRVAAVIPTERQSYPQYYPNFISIYFSIALYCSGDMYAAVPKITPTFVAAMLTKVGEFERVDAGVDSIFAWLQITVDDAALMCCL